jgi:hypothetical protein
MSMPRRLTAFARSTGSGTSSISTPTGLKLALVAVMLYGQMVCGQLVYGQTPHSVLLNWTAPVNSPVPVAHYRVFRSRGGRPWQVIANPPQTTFTDTQVASGQHLRYQVSSVAADGTQSVRTPPTPTVVIP